MGGDVGEVKRREGVKSALGHGTGDAGDVVEGVDDEVASDAIFVSHRLHRVLRARERLDAGDLRERSDAANAVYGEKFDLLGEMFRARHPAETPPGHAIGLAEAVD